MRCIYCNEEVPDGSAFCPVCGGDLSTPVPPPLPTTPVPPVPPVAPVAAYSADERSSRKKIWIIVGVVAAVVVVAALVGAAFFFGKKYSSLGSGTIQYESVETTSPSAPDSTSAPAEAPAPEKPRYGVNKWSGIFHLSGKISRYPVAIVLTIDNEGAISGYCSYTDHPSWGKTLLEGWNSDDGFHVSMTEREPNSYTETASIDGYWDNGNMYGTFIRERDGKEMSFELYAQ